MTHRESIHYRIMAIFTKKKKVVAIEYYTTLFQDHLDQVIQSREPRNLYDPVNYIMTLGGKRIRPSLALMSCHLFGSDPRRALDAAMAVEMFHNFTLIHDDIMDRAELRRGKMTVHKKWDLNSGILSGDVLMILSYRQLENYQPELYQSLMRIFNKTAIEVCEGQQMDMDFEERTHVEAEEYFKMIKFKTAVLLGCALSMGARVSGAAESDQEAIYDFGTTLGLAFQLQDDYLDSFGGSDFGKRIGGDILERKKTFLYIKTLELAGEDDRKALLGHYAVAVDREQEKTGEGSSENEETISEVNRIFQKYGADTLLLKEIEKLTAKALQIIERLSIDESGKNLLRDFSHLLMKRKV
jgi:geranylgeranyl diphosphate synthase type II